MRIVSTLPSATEIVYALGLGDQLVGVSHTCDYPAEARAKPVVSRSVRRLSHLSSQEIDGIIQQARANNNPVHWIDGNLLRELRPDLIITQEICEVCAIGSGSVYETAAKALDYTPNIIVTRPVGLAEIYQNIHHIAAAAGVPQRAEKLVAELQARVERVRVGLGPVERPARVFCIDWLTPLRNTGQWTPELVELAGGTEGLAEKWGISREVPWEEVQEYQPDYIMVMPCAFDMARTVREAPAELAQNPVWASLPAVQQGRVYLFDGLIPSRHGPRVIDVLEGLAEAMHPERFAGLAPAGVFQQAQLN
jgi:iron complex transport system substrate-binding protein